MHPDLKEQIEVVSQTTNRSIIDPANFFESERNSGYKNTGTALFELIDNSYQANANKIHIVADYHEEKGKKTNKPKSIAVIDNGNGMPKDYLHIACKIAGTHRSSALTPLKRSGYGRFGHGLPKSSISQTKSFTVYTKTESDQNWRSLEVDIDKLVKQNTTELPQEIENSKLPNYIFNYIKNSFKNENGENFKSGTIVSWNNLDRMTWKTDAALYDNVFWKISTSYWRNIKSGVEINFLGKNIKPIDPLFIDKGCEYVDECQGNTIKAIEKESWTWPVKIVDGKEEQKVDIKIRMSRFPRFFGTLKMSGVASKGNQTIRAKIMKQYRGILFYREGRLIDIMRHIPLDSPKQHQFQSYDDNYMIEVNFPAKLDEPMGVSTNKQYINPSNQMILSDGFQKLVKECKLLYNEVESNFKSVQEELEKGEDLAIKAIDEVEEFFSNKKNDDPEAEEKAKRIKELADKNLNQIIDLEVERRKKVLNQDIDKEKVRAEITPQFINPKRQLKFENLGEHSPFFRIEPIAGVRLVTINQDHNFFKRIWSNTRCTSFMKQILELLIFAIGESSLGASSDARRWYYVEMTEWSKNLHLWTDKLFEDNDYDDTSENLDDKLPN